MPVPVIARGMAGLLVAFRRSVKKLFQWSSMDFSMSGFARLVLIYVSKLSIG